MQGFAIYLRSQLSYDAAAKASKQGKKAFAQAYGGVIKNMKESRSVSFGAFFGMELRVLPSYKAYLARPSQ